MLLQFQWLLESYFPISILLWHLRFQVPAPLFSCQISIFFMLFLPNPHRAVQKAASDITNWFNSWSTKTNTTDCAYFRWDDGFELGLCSHELTASAVPRLSEEEGSKRKKHTFSISKTGSKELTIHLFTTQNKSHFRVSYLRKSRSTIMCPRLMFIYSSRGKLLSKKSMNILCVNCYTYEYDEYVMSTVYQSVNNRDSSTVPQRTRSRDLWFRNYRNHVLQK